MEWVSLLLYALAFVIGFAIGWRFMEYLFGGAGRREGYGPPPGMRRALHHEELGDRGWPGYPFEYAATTASAISHMVERSA
jgi:hypothetical protein